MEKHVHEWSGGLVKNGKSGKRKIADRAGFTCASCRLTALPPKSAKKAMGWQPPA